MQNKIFDDSALNSVSDNAVRITKQIQVLTEFSSPVFSLGSNQALSLISSPNLQVSECFHFQSLNVKPISAPNH